MRQILVNTGKFKSYKGNKYVTSDAYARVGALYLRENFHVCMALEDGAKADSLITPKPKYYDKYKGNSPYISEALEELGIDGSYSYRKVIAKTNNITMYIGTKAQNTKILELLKKGLLLRPNA